MTVLPTRDEGLGPWSGGGRHPLSTGRRLEGSSSSDARLCGDHLLLSGHAWLGPWKATETSSLVVTSPAWSKCRSHGSPDRRISREGHRILVSRLEACPPHRSNDLTNVHPGCRRRALPSFDARGQVAWSARPRLPGRVAPDASRADARLARPFGGEPRRRAPARSRSFDPHVRDAPPDLGRSAGSRARRSVGTGCSARPAPPPSASHPSRPRVRRGRGPAARRPDPDRRDGLRARAGGRYTSRRCPRAGGGVRHGPGPHRLAA